MSKHILLYSDDPGLGGVAQYNHTLLCGLATLGYKLTCVQSKIPNPLLNYQNELGIEHIWLEFDTTKDTHRTITDASHAQNILEIAKPDLIIFSDTWPLANSGVKRVAIAMGVPYIVVVGYVAPYPGGLPSAFLNETTELYDQALAVVAVSSENLHLLHDLFGLPVDKGQVIHYGRPPQYFAYSQPSVRERLRQELGIPSDAVVCFTSARLEPVKGYLYQLAAIEQLKNTDIWHSLYFIWAGGGKLKNELVEAVGQLELTNKIKILGQRWDIPELLDASDIFILPSMSEGMPLAIMEAMAKGLPVIASAVSGIPEELGDTGKLLPDPKIDAQATVNELVKTIQSWCIDKNLCKSIGQNCKKRAESLFKEERMIMETHELIETALSPTLSLWDYISPEFEIVCPDSCFPNMIVGDTNNCLWPYLRRDIPHNWYVDRRQPDVGFLNRDEAHILYNTALQFEGKKALEIGCWLGWSACHLALGGVELDVVDPLLDNPNFFESINSSLDEAGVLSSVNLVGGYSPQKVEELAQQFQRKWSLIFIDGNHDTPSPLNDAIVCEKYAEEDALILFHDLTSPDVTEGLEYLRQKGFKVMIYQTMQIMGVAWRGNVEPVMHDPDPQVDWHLPKHLQNYSVSNMPNEQFINENIIAQKVQATMQQAIDLLNSRKLIEAVRLAESLTSFGINIPEMNYIRAICLYSVEKYPQAFEAAKAELEINPNHRQAQELVNNFSATMFKQQTKVVTKERSWNTSLPQETLLSIQHASQRYSYKGVPMIKNPFDLALYPLLLWNLQPRTIIEIGSNCGGSALWLADMLSNFGIDGHVLSIDILKVTAVNHPRVTFIEGNGQKLEETFDSDFLKSLPRPFLVIEDADHSYETSKHVLEFFNQYLQKGEYIVIEDGIISDLTQDISCNSGPHRALKEFISNHSSEYEVDDNYCDFFGYNLTWCTNGFLKKVQDYSENNVNSDSINQLFSYLNNCQAQNLSFEQLKVSSRHIEKISNNNQQGKLFFDQGNLKEALDIFKEVIALNPISVIANKYLSFLYWQNNDVLNSLKCHIFSQYSNPSTYNDDDEFKKLLAIVKPYTLLSESRLFSLYSLAKQICLDDIPGNFVECGAYKGGSVAVLAFVIKKYSLRSRVLYAFDTFEGMPQPNEIDQHDHISANSMGFGVGTLKAPIEKNLDIVCEALKIKDIVVPVKGLFAETLPKFKSQIDSIAFLHADGDWYESTLEIFNNLYDSVVPYGVIQIDDYGFWDGCRKAIHEFERSRCASFALRIIDDTGVWFYKENLIDWECNHWRTFWHLAQASEKMGDMDLAKQAAEAVLQIMPRLIKAEEMLIRLKKKLQFCPIELNIAKI